MKDNAINSLTKETKEPSLSLSGGDSMQISSRPISKLVNNIINLAYQNEILALREEFEKNPDLTLYDIVDKRDYTSNVVFILLSFLTKRE